MLGSVKIKNLKKDTKRKKLKQLRRIRRKLNEKIAQAKRRSNKPRYYEISNKCGEKLVLFGQKLFGILREWKIDRENSGLSSRRTLERRDKIT